LVLIENASVLVCHMTCIANGTENCLVSSSFVTVFMQAPPSEWCWRYYVFRLFVCACVPKFGHSMSCNFGTLEDKDEL